jgi:thioredoxin reductase
LLIDKETTGGQAGTSSRIENYLGFPNGLSGADLARRATAQAGGFGSGARLNGDQLCPSILKNCLGQ